MTELQQKQLNFLTDTVNHYNINNRGINPKTGKCSYEYGCAIGRHLDQNLAKRFDYFPLGVNLFAGVRINNEIAFNELDPKLKELGRMFLFEIQQLHDNARNWNKHGLSEYGQNNLNELKTYYGLNTEN